MKNAFTLVETIVLIAVITLVSITLGMLLVYFYKTNAYTLEQSVAVAQSRKGVEDSMLYLREATFGSDGSYPISTATTTYITFYANMNNDATVERITYRRIGNIFYRTVVTPTGNPLSYTNGAIATTTVATSITNTNAVPIFRYFDSASVELTYPIAISRISSIRTTVVIDVNVNRAPVALTLSAGATLRNLQNQQ
jgi:type II secretory pathway pseudopilin PulG